jgi:hypothetical protein
LGTYTHQDAGLVQSMVVSSYDPSNAKLADLATKQGTLTPASTPTTTNYTASVANGVTCLAVTPAALDFKATVKVNGTLVPYGSTTSCIPLTAGLNTINIIVTAADALQLKLM